MITYGTKALGAQRRRAIDVAGDLFHKGEWMDSGQAPGLAPTVFLVEQGPDILLQPHFHRRNQFQLFVDGEGTLGPERIRPVTIHYAGAFTGYGPIRSGPAGLKYFTIRSAFESGLVPATEARQHMVRGPKRHAQAHVGAPLDAAQLAALQQVRRRDVIEANAGLGAELLQLPPLAVAAVAPLAASPGQFVVVLSGVARVGEVELQPWESAFVPATDGAVQLAAGPGGAEVLALHIPQQAADYRAA